MRIDEEILKNQNFHSFHSDGVGKLYINGRDVMVTWSRYKYFEVASASPMDDSELTTEEIEYIKDIFFTEDEKCKRLRPDEGDRVPNCIHLFHYIGRE